MQQCSARVCAEIFFGRGEGAGELMQGQVNSILKITQEVPKTRRTKIKGQFRPFSQLQAPRCALIWRLLLEGQTKTCWDESYFVGLPNVSSFAGPSYFGFCKMHFAGRAFFPPIADLAPGNPVSCFGMFPLLPLDLRLIFWFRLIINIPG